MLSYLGEPARKQQAMQRLRALQDARAWVLRPVYWSGQAGSVVGSLLHGDDLDAWERQYGLPKWLALAVDSLFVSAPDLQQGVAAGTALLEAVPVGVDARTAGNRFLHALLESGQYGVAASLPEGPLARALHAVAALHARQWTDGDVSAAQWRQVRGEAVAATDALDKASLDAAIGACVEAAAWDPATSRTAVSDACRCWLAAMGQVAVARRSPWTAADHQRIDALLGRLHAEAKAQAPDDDRFIDVFQLLEQHQPQEAEGLKAYLAIQREEHAVHWRRSVTCLQEILVAERQVALAVRCLMANAASP